MIGLLRAASGGVGIVGGCWGLLVVGGAFFWAVRATAHIKPLLSVKVRCMLNK